jgi:hypothetical protein
MKIVYFISREYPYDTAIYSGVGPRYARMFGWPTAPIDEIAAAECDVAIIDNRTLEKDRRAIDRFLSGGAPRFPIMFKLSDPEMPRQSNASARYVLGKQDVPGVHYVSIYDPAGPLRDFAASLTRSKVLRLPFPYDGSQDVERGFADRRRRVFLSGGYGRDLYPLRTKLRRQRLFNPLARWLVHDLAHPGYPENAKKPRHTIMFDRYIAYAAQFTHFFLCPSRYRVELMKFVECANAGSVPIGEPPDSLKDHVGHCFIAYSGRAAELRRAVGADTQDMQARAAEYRRIMRALRDPARLTASLEEQMRTAL